jgi:hypothetical protein
VESLMPEAVAAPPSPAPPPRTRSAAAHDPGGSMALFQTESGAPAPKSTGPAHPAASLPDRESHR